MVVVYGFTEVIDCGHWYRVHCKVGRVWMGTLLGAEQQQGWQHVTGCMNPSILGLLS